MKYLKYYFVFLLIIFFMYLLIRCETESPLSDVELTDPSVILLEIDTEVIHMLNADVSKLFRAIFKDKKGDYIQLKDGGVRVNGHKLDVKKTELNNAPLEISCKILL